ncbi:hypothetical protein RJP21_15410 [Paenibacillus sp. VCA1]|uniref:Uncharacterized protein n=1 Tax=Paenibacillus albilobatus TaxID=2716884 RepID=A0A919XCX9_9BACL|nr:hypothetical protein [Paenibacillus sp. VCA1]MDR9855002.1 hypothetical protein [Paenibacillus sp. VCA1]GIO29369.1 hypothetical protein J2TS6_05100 [Paenibacillus albilobatus]
MLRKLKSYFQERCPECSEKLHATTDSLRCIKSCPNRHYTEETYSHLNIRIIYHN